MVAYEELFQRNIGIFTQEEQERIKNAKVAIAGVGGDGGLIAETLARAGIGKIKIADPATFEVSNINRQNGCCIDTLGKNKAEVIESVITRINPLCEVEVFNDGVHENNVSAFIDGSDIVIDESEFTDHRVAVMIAREARRQSIPLVTGLNVGFGALMFSFPPEGILFEKYLGLSENSSLEEIASTKVSINKWCPWLPSYVNLQVFREVEAGNIAVPGISPSVALVSSIVSTEILLFLVNRKQLVAAPKYIWVDPYWRKIKIRRSNKFAFLSSLFLMILKSSVNKKPVRNKIN